VQFDDIGRCPVLIVEEIKKTDARYAHGHVYGMERRSSSELRVEFCANAGDLAREWTAPADTTGRWDFCHHGVAQIVLQHKMIVGVASGAAFHLEICQCGIDHKNSVLGWSEAGVCGQGARR